MPAWAITEKKSLKTEYVGIHLTRRDAIEIYLGYPSNEEVAAFELRYVCEEVDLYPKAQRMRMD